MDPSAVIADPDRLEWESWPDDQVAERGRVRWKTLFSADRDGTAGIFAGLGSLAPGEELSEHSHPQHEAYFVVSGTATVTIEDDRHEVAAGGGAFIPGGVRHSCRNEGDEEVRFVFTFPTDSGDDVDYDF